jgi:hypothetical protein
MDPLQRMQIEQTCRDLVLRAAACADGHAPAQLAALFTEDGVLERPSGEPLRGRAAIARAYAERPADRLTRHLVTNTRVEIESPAQARALSYVLLWTGLRLDQAGPFGPLVRQQMVGEFDDTFVATEAGWRIARRIARFVLHTG